MVIGIDKERGKVQLGVKQLSEDPWESIARAYPRGSIINGEITNITDFGFFVRVQGGIEGLVHKMNIVDDSVEPAEPAHGQVQGRRPRPGGGDRSAARPSRSCRFP